MQERGAERTSEAAIVAASDDVGDSSSAQPHVRLGAWLRSERLRRGFSYAEVERDTHINRLYLEALEDEHYDVLPAPIYTRGFVKLYARALGIDPSGAAAMLPADLPIPPGLEPSAALRRPGREAPAISLPKLPSMRVPALRVPELRTPRAGLRLPSLGGRSSSNGGRGGTLGLKLPSISLGQDARRWLLAGIGVAILLLAGYFLPRYFETPSSAGTQAVATSAAATAQAGGNTTQSTPPAGSTSNPSVTTPVPTGPALGNLVGMTRADAQKALDDLGLTYVVNEAPSATVQAGQVIAQFPSAGARLNKGDNVVLSVSRGAPKP